MSHVSQTMSISKTFKAFAAVLAALMLGGCAGPIERWIVNTRVHQGDVALEHENVQDAELAYRLALRVDPSNERARAGFVGAAAALAQSEYTRGNFNDALATINDALKYDPASVRLAALKAAIDGAILKREIVLQNYPTSQEAGLQIAHAYAQLVPENALILKSLRKFSYTYDTQDLIKAIKQSYELQLELTKNTNRLINYRQLVESGVPVTEQAVSTGGAGSLLPLP
jgi:tetratricopeptide (TPR) repeat protein